MTRTTTTGQGKAEQHGKEATQGSAGQRVASRGAGWQHWTTGAAEVELLHKFCPITLDPCSNPASIVRADVSACEAGLDIPWHWYGHTYVNPPYNSQWAWISKAVSESKRGATHITMIIPASPETKNWTGGIWPTADRVAFFDHRLKFGNAPPPEPGKKKSDSNSLPSAIIYWGRYVSSFDEVFGDVATVMTDWKGKR